MRPARQSLKQRDALVSFGSCEAGLNMCATQPASICTKSVSSNPLATGQLKLFNSRPAGKAGRCQSAQRPSIQGRHQRCPWEAPGHEHQEACRQALLPTCRSHARQGRQGCLWPLDCRRRRRLRHHPSRILQVRPLCEGLLSRTRRGKDCGKGSCSHRSGNNGCCETVGRWALRSRKGLSHHERRQLGIVRQ